MSPREKLLEVIETLSDVQLENVLHYAESVTTHEQKPPYDPDQDPMIGMFSGPTDLSERAEEILYDDIKSTSGWTQKEENE
jgi:hypothetical protein